MVRISGGRNCLMASCTRVSLVHFPREVATTARMASFTYGDRRIPLVLRSFSGSVPRPCMRSPMLMPVGSPPRAGTVGRVDSVLEIFLEVFRSLSTCCRVVGAGSVCVAAVWVGGLSEVVGGDG